LDLFLAINLLRTHSPRQARWLRRTKLVIELIEPQPLFGSIIFVAIASTSSAKSL